MTIVPHIELHIFCSTILRNKELNLFLFVFALNKRIQRTPTCFLHTVFLQNKAEICAKKHRVLFLYWIKGRVQKFSSFGWHKKKRPKSTLTPFFHWALQFEHQEAFYLYLKLWRHISTVKPGAIEIKRKSKCETKELRFKPYGHNQY